jgi:hypothetical protein
LPFSTISSARFFTLARGARTAPDTRARNRRNVAWRPGLSHSGRNRPFKMKRVGFEHLERAVFARYGGRRRRTTGASDRFGDCDSRRAFRLSSTDRAQRMTNRSIAGGRVQLDSVCSWSGPIFRRRYQAGALAGMGDSWTRHVRMRQNRTRSVRGGDPESVIRSDPA